MLRKHFSFFGSRTLQRSSESAETFSANASRPRQPLNNLEIAFLSLLDGKRANDPSVLGWWCAFNKVDGKRAIHKLYTNNYLTLADYKFSVRKSTIPTLKEFLKTHSLSTKGRKDELVARVIDNIAQQECLIYFPDTYWALTPEAVEILNAQKLKDQEEYNKSISLIRKGDYEALKRKLYPNRNEHWGTEDIFCETIDFLMRYGFEGFGLSEDIRRNASSFVAARAVDYNSRGHSTCMEELFNYLKSVSIEIAALHIPNSLQQYAVENGDGSPEIIYDIYIRFITDRARSIAELSNYRRLGFKKIRIDAAACRECGRTTTSKVYSTREAPLLPLTWNCGCIYLI